ncbi:MAG: flavin reductase [Clostridiaceae bacterium]|nr:flavin reductase [Clostridiaceae bacterium]
MDKAAMYDLSYGLYVLTAKEGDKDNGCIINTAVQVTTTPNRITIAINKQNYTHDMILRTGLFNVSMISEKAVFPLFERFGFQSGKDVDKFDGFQCPASENGIKYVPEGVSSYISCKVVSQMDLGTHTLFLADVTDGVKLSKDAPMTYAYYHKNIKPKPVQPSKPGGYRCKICGYIYEGEPLPEDFICPICKHGAIDFEKIV